METSLIDSTVDFNPSLSDADVEECIETDTDTEEKAGTVYRQKKRFNSVARRKIEEYLEMKNLERQTQDFFYDDLFIDNG